MFVDHQRIYAKAGDGGAGCASFRRVKYTPKGGPDGGDGGDGGSVVLVVDPHTDHLRDFFYNPHLKAKNGLPGMGQQKTGKSGKNLIRKVPPGTVVYQSDETKDDFIRYDEDGHPLENQVRREPTLTKLADLTEDGTTFVLAQGGKGGKGNIHFKSSINRAPHETTPGTAGQEGFFYLELRRIADAGLVGFPNAGKSTILSKVSAAKPKVAAYPFTTLNPMVGVVELEGYQRATLADIPGLIEGAHQNVGLGHDFLRHIMRCQLLLFVLDMAGSEGRDPGEDLAKLRTEIKEYDEGLAKRQWIVVANKMDLPEAEENLTLFRSRFPRLEVVPISADQEKGLEDLKDAFRRLLISESAKQSKRRSSAEKEA